MFLFKVAFEYNVGTSADETARAADGGRVSYRQAETLEKCYELKKGRQVLERSLFF